MGAGRLLTVSMYSPFGAGFLAVGRDILAQQMHREYLLSLAISLEAVACIATNVDLC